MLAAASPRAAITPLRYTLSLYTLPPLLMPVCTYASAAAAASAMPADAAYALQLDATSIHTRYLRCHLAAIAAFRRY